MLLTAYDHDIGFVKFKIKIFFTDGQLLDDVMLQHLVTMLTSLVSMMTM